MMVGILQIPMRLTDLEGPIALAVGAGGGCLHIFLSSIISPLSHSLWETTRYRLKYCLKGLLNPKTTHKPTTSYLVHIYSHLTEAAASHNCTYSRTPMARAILGP